MSDQPEAAARPRGMPTWILFGIATVSGLFYAYIVWNAVTLLVYQASGALGLNAFGWFVLLFAVLFPVVVFAGAFALGRRRGPLSYLLVMLTGLALVVVFWLNVLAYAYVFGGSLLGG